MRFWISVDSLNRPPTLLTIPSSFRSSSISAPLELPGDDRAQLGGGPGEVVVTDLILILLFLGEFGPGRLQPAADDRLVLRPPHAQAPLQLLRRRVYEYRHVVRAQPADLLGPLHVDDEDHPVALVPRLLHLGLERSVVVSAEHDGVLQERP